MIKLVRSTLLIGAFLVLVTGAAQAAPTPGGPANLWALGVDNLSGCPGDIDQAWDHSAGVSLSRCPKNPSPFGPDQPGAAFKNGPKSGAGQAGLETVSAQEFTVAPAAYHTFQFSTLIVCVRCDYLTADLYGDGVYLGRLLDFDPLLSTPAYYHDGNGRNNWGGYIGPELVTGHYETYRIEIRTMWTAANSLGIKWTGLELAIDEGQ